MEKLIQYTKIHFKPSRQYGYARDIDKMVDEAVEWMLNMVSINNSPNGKIDIDLFRKEMAEWFMSCY
jgi:hypothetical protein